MNKGNYDDIIMEASGLGSLFGDMKDDVIIANIRQITKDTFIDTLGPMISRKLWKCQGIKADE